MNEVKNEQSITEKLLINNDWERDEILSQFAELENYKKFNKNINNEWFISLTYMLTNSISRDWNCQIDNSRHEGIASANIQTIDHFNKFMELMDIDYRL